MQSWTWRNLEFVLPEDWEMLQFSRDPAKGRCAFADRNQFRFELDWRQVPGCPDFGRMLSDYMSRLQERGMTDGQIVTAGAWQGIDGNVDGKGMSRFGWYSELEGCVVETVFLWPGVRDQALESVVLDSIRESSPDAEGRLRWRAFGMNISVPGGWSLHRCRVEPGLAEMIFRDGARRRGEVIFERRGILDQWLKDPVAQWLRGRAASVLEKMDDPKRSVSRGHEKVTITGINKGPGLLGRRSAGRAEGWICPADGRLYNIIGFGRENCILECCAGA